MEVVVRREGDRYKCVLSEDGTEASWAYITDRLMRIGSATLTVGGIADVETPKEHRMKGYSRQVLDLAVQWMIEKAYDLSLLFGIPDYYHRFGYATVMPEPALALPVEHIPAENTGLKVCKIQPRDRAEVLALYNRATRGRTGAAVRRDWKGFGLKPQWPPFRWAIVARRPSGTLAGYAVAVRKSKGLGIGEIFARSIEDYRSLLIILADKARAADEQQLVLSAAADDPVVRVAVGFGATQTVTWRNNAGAMGRICNLPSLISKVAPELSRRLGDAGALWDGVVTLETDMGQVRLRVEGYRVRVFNKGAARTAVLRCDQAVLLQLLIGYRDAEEALAAGDVSVACLPRSLLRALFPSTIGHMYRPDRF